MGGEGKEQEETRGQEADEEKMEKAWERGKRGCAPRVEGDERETGVEEAYCGGPERVGKEPERLKGQGEGRRVEK